MVYLTSKIWYIKNERRFYDTYHWYGFRSKSFHKIDDVNEFDHFNNFNNQLSQIWSY